MNMQEVLKNLNINESELIQRFSGNYPLLERFMRKFVQDPTYERLRAAMDNKAYDDALNQAHTLKGVAANLGMESLFEACSQMVADLREGNTAPTEENFELVSQEYKTVIQWLSQLP